MLQNLNNKLSTISFDKFKIFSGSFLKIVAILSMLIDHAALVIFSRLDWATASVTVLGRAFSIYSVMRLIGRLAFPIFCFLITEGFVHTRNRKKYGLSLLLFALISEIPFNLMVGGSFVYLGGQNVYFTLFLGFLLLCVFENVSEPYKRVLCAAGIIIAAYLLRADYGLRGVLLIGIIYIFREERLLRTLFAFPCLSGGLAAFSAFIPINMYNGRRGFIKGKAAKYVFYIFYPLHIIILLVIKQFI